MTNANVIYVQHADTIMTNTNHNKLNRHGELKSFYKGCLGIFEGQNYVLYNLDQDGAFPVEVNVRGNGKEFVYN